MHSSPTTFPNPNSIHEPLLLLSIPTHIHHHPWEETGPQNPPSVAAPPVNTPHQGRVGEPRSCACYSVAIYLHFAIGNWILYFVLLHFVIFQLMGIGIV